METTNVVEELIEDNLKGIPFKITDTSREIKKGIVAISLKDLTSKLIGKKIIVGSSTENDIKIVLECDGTEVDDEEYFATLEKDTVLMVLIENQRWKPRPPIGKLSVDDVDGSKRLKPELANIVDKIHSNFDFVSLLGGPELELLSDMDPDSIVDVTYPDKMFLEQLKEASGRFLSEKREAQDAMDLLKLYSGNRGPVDEPEPPKERV